MNTSYFLYLKKEKTDQVFSLKMRKQKLIAETEMINIKLKKINAIDLQKQVFKSDYQANLPIFN